MAKPKGTKNKRSRELLFKLEKEHNFRVVRKIVQIYNEMEELAKPIVEKAISNAKLGYELERGISEEELEMMNNYYKNAWNILGKLLAYCYPKLKALEVGTADTDNVTFNINIPAGSTVTQRGKE